MTRKDVTWLGFLALAAAAIWLRDRRWAADAANVLPALAGFPLMAWLGSPWRLKGPFQIHPTTLAVALSAAVAGLALDLTLLLAAAWTAALWAWLHPRLEPIDRRRIGGLLVLPFAAFPWIALDLQPLGWWFRLSGAHATEIIFGSLGFDIAREGTHLLVHGMPVEVTAACAGLNTLQAMLIAGAFLAYTLLGGTRFYAWNLALLLPLAWLANTTRILTLTAAALTWGQEFAMGAFHAWGGLIVIVAMFAACWILFQWQAALITARP